MDNKKNLRQNEEKLERRKNKCSAWVFINLMQNLEIKINVILLISSIIKN
jgi:hypothetical protein